MGIVFFCPFEGMDSDLIFDLKVISNALSECSVSNIVMQLLSNCFFFFLLGYSIFLE